MTTPYWLSEPLPDVPTLASAEALELGRRGQRPVDVVVVGGGVTGCSCALTLARGGLRVRLLEAHEIAGGASGRNGGFALRGGCPSYDDARVTLGVPAARSLWRLTERALDGMEQLAGGALRRVGSLRLAVDQAERDEIARECEALQADGFHAEWLDPLPGSLGELFAGGFLHPGDGALDPAVWVRRLAGHAAAAGAELVEHAPVTREELDQLDAQAIVIAVDGMTEVLVPELAPWVVPMRGQVLATEPLPEQISDRPHYARGGYDYWQQLPNGRLILGGRRDTSLETEQTSVAETTALIQDGLEEFAAKLIGRPPRITHRWAGVWGQTPDRMPFAGRVPGLERLWVAGGYSGHGNVLGFACGNLVARAILGEDDPDLALFDPARMA
ncbi:MAG TPA: FAD-dependent oxidoreductase [Gaiellaceae bacterium]|jgi:glycine/D-amino acid oxidase-like deaminating enzyme